MWLAKSKHILSKFKKGCSFFYKCLKFKKQQSFNWNKQKTYWEGVLNKTYEDAEWDPIINSYHDVEINNYHKEHQLRLFGNDILTNKGKHIIYRVLPDIVSIAQAPLKMYNIMFMSAPNQCLFGGCWSRY